MKLSASNSLRTSLAATSWPLYGLLLFTLLSGIGYATFGRHPEWLQHIPAPFISQLTLFFGIAFTFFAQGHILISCSVLFIYLIYRTKASWIPAFLAVYILSLSSELSGTLFGIPFGEYTYTEMLGIKWFSLVPLLIPISWFTMALPSFALAYYCFSKPGQWAKRILFGSLLLTLWDLSLDPAMSYLTTYWTWGEPGPYYGMPWINLGGWYVTSIVLMVAFELLQSKSWIQRLSIRWVSAYYGLILLLPTFMVLAAGLWGALVATLAVVVPCAWFIDRKLKQNRDSDFMAFGTIHRATNETSQPPDALQSDGLKDFFSSHSRSFSFAARFFSSDQYQLVTRLYAFCRTTDDISDTVALREGSDKAEQELNEWEQRVYLSYQGIPSGIEWLDELMNRSNRAGVPFELIQDLIAGVRTDLREVEINTVDELDRYCYCVASVVGIWLCYLFGVRDREILERASAMGRAMQVTNILRDVGEDLRMDRLYLPTELMEGYGVTKEFLMEVEAGKQPITDAYKSLIEDLMERAESDYQYAFRGLSAIPTSFARAAAVASEIYKGIHQAIRRNRYDNFRRRAYTRWYEKIWLSFRALKRLKQVQHRPFITTAEPVFFSNQQLSNNHRRQKPLISTLICAMLYLQFNVFMPPGLQAQPFSTVPSAPSVHENSLSIPHSLKLKDYMDPTHTYTLQVRDLYLAGVEKEEAIEQGLELIEASPEKTNLLHAYRAALIVLKAKHAFWPQKKMKFLNEGIPELNELVELYPDHIEIRYLRLLSCYYLPRFLGMSSSVREDAQLLTTLLPDARKNYPPELYQSMVRFVKENRELSLEEKKVFESKLLRSHSQQAIVSYE